MAASQFENICFVIDASRSSARADLEPTRLDACKQSILEFMRQRKAMEEDIQTFHEYAESFMAGYSVMNHKASTHESYQSALDLHLLPVFGKMPLDMITRKPKNRIGAKAENGNTLNPIITESALKAIPLPVVVKVLITASLSDSPRIFSSLYRHRKWIV